MVGAFKIVTLAAAVNEGLVNVFEDKYYDSGKIKVANATLHCWKHKGHGSQTFLQVVENSCNLGVNTGTYLNLKKNLQII